MDRIGKSGGRGWWEEKSISDKGAIKGEEAVLKGEKRCRELAKDANIVFNYVTGDILRHMRGC